MNLYHAVFSTKSVPNYSLSSPSPQALLVNRDVCDHLREGPVDLPALLVQLEEDEEGGLIDEILELMQEEDLFPEGGPSLSDMVKEIAREFPTVGDLKREMEKLVLKVLGTIFRK